MSSRWGRRKGMLQFVGKLWFWSQFYHRACPQTRASLHNIANVITSLCLGHHNIPSHTHSQHDPTHPHRHKVTTWQPYADMKTVLLKKEGWRSCLTKDTFITCLGENTSYVSQSLKNQIKKGRYEQSLCTFASLLSSTSFKNNRPAGQSLAVSATVL